MNYTQAPPQKKDLISFSFDFPIFLFLSSLLLCYNCVQVILQYNEGLLTKQERCRHFIIRQLDVLGKDTTEEEVNEMVATGKWEVFNENLLNDAKITRSQLSEIEERHKVLQRLLHN